MCGAGLRRGAGAVLVSGDIAESGNRAQLKAFADTWYGVFPGDKAPDGRRVERLFVYGKRGKPIYSAVSV